MAECIYNLAVLFLSLVGVATLVRLMYMKMLFPKSSPSRFYVVRMDSDSCENELRAAVGFAKEIGGKYCCKVVCVKQALDADAENVCEQYRKKYPDIIICTDGELAGRLMEI